ncbi:GNAT family N-acetyltransferase [Streptomyces avicenniae]|uniref:GNAT family N-acetyltransferase n=1 Tax=Streptomyces avicenniae TaxID=500153 RepID=UPI00069A86EF|nr:GNAT family N-acetyltransferase [Streptomyces avicenniae]
MSTALFARHDARLGEFALRPVDPGRDSPLLHRWLTHPKSVFWLMGDATVEDVEKEYRTLAERPTHDAFLGLHKGRPAFLAERYDPAADPVGRAFTVQPGDIGMHFLTAPTDTPQPGFTRAVLTTVMAFLFDDPSVRRVVVEPDIRNEPVHRLNAAVGFEAARTVPLPGKDALLSFCTRAQFTTAVSPGATR